MAKNAREMILDSDELDVNTETGVTEPSVILNELLAYYTYYMNKGSIEPIVNAIILFYTPDEIRRAKDLLWRYYGHRLLGKYQKRRGGNNVPVEKADMKDIQDALRVIDTTLDENEQHSYVAQNMGRLPRAVPEEAEAGSMLARIRNLELEFARMDRVVTQNAVTIEENTRAIEVGRDHAEAIGQASYEATAAAAAYVKAANQQVQHAQPGGKVQRRDGVHQPRRTVPVSGGPPGDVRNNDNDVRNNDVRNKGVDIARQHNSGMVDHHMSDRSDSDEQRDGDGIDEQGFQLGRDERRKQRRKAVFGNKGRSDTLKTGGKPRELFLFGLDADVTAEEIAGYIQGEDNSITVIGDIERRSREGADTTSFLIKVSWSDSKKLMESEFWPEGAGIRQYFRKRKQRPAGAGDS